MKLLLDTHIWLWAVAEPERLGPRLLDRLRDGATELWLSPISVWEALLLATARVLDLTLVTADARLLAGTGYATLDNR